MGGDALWRMHMATHIEVSQTQLDALLEQAQSDYPLETCGLMAGQQHRVRRLYPVENIRKSRVEYEMDPKQQLAAMIDMEEQGWDLIAIYHSHPNGPQVPSATDIDKAYYPEAAHLIVSLIDKAKPQVRAFYIVAGTVTEIPLQVV